MKNSLLYILVIFSCFFVACQKNEVESIFDKLPEERMVERNQELKNALIENENGWKAFLKTSASGSGFGFYMKFNSDETVLMYSDWDDATASTGQTSTYSIRYIMNTSLIFDTYNYISIMQDPQKTVNGGNQPDGLQSDIEFEYIRKSEDTVVLQGKKYRNFLYLIKATSSEKAKYENGDFESTVSDFRDYFTSHFNNYIELSGDKTGVFFSPDFKTIEIQAKDENGNILSGKQGFGLSMDGGFFVNSISIAGNTFIGFKVKGAGYAIIDADGKEYDILQNPVPLVNLYEMFGSTNDKAYNSIYLINGTRPANISSDFNAVYDGMLSRFAGTGRSIDTLEIILNTNTTAFVRIWYWSGTTHFLADASFSYEFDPSSGTLVFSDFKSSVSNGNWDTRKTQIGNFADWIQDGPFIVDWAASDPPDGVNYGGLYKESDQNDFFYGFLRKRRI